MLTKLTLILLLVAVVPSVGDSPDEARQNYEMGIAFPLRQAGIDPIDSTSLIRAITANHPLSILAVSALGYLPPTNAAVSLLKSTLSSGNDLKVTLAAGALNRLRVHDWTSLARARVYSAQLPEDGGVLAARMAEAGDYSAWPYFLGILSDSKTTAGVFDVLARWIDEFDQMPGTRGARLALAHDLHEILPRLPKERQDRIWKEISRVQSSAAAVKRAP